MAIYKPSNCTPFLNSLDLSEPQDIQCELNTSNVNIVGYKMRVLDNKNNIIFKGKNFTQLTDATLFNYYNTGENGSTLTLPLIVDNPSYSNENNLFFAGYKWSPWKPSYDLISSDTFLYIYGEEYLRVTSETLTQSEYAKIDNIYENVNGYFKKMEIKPSYAEAQVQECYYLFGGKNKYTQIKSDKVTEGDYIRFKYVYRGRVGDEKNTKVIRATTSANSSGQYIATGEIDVTGGVLQVEVTEKFFNTNDGGDISQLKIDVNIKSDENNIIQYTVTSGANNAQVTFVISYIFGYTDTDGATYSFSYLKPDKAQAISDNVYYRQFIAITTDEEIENSYNTIPIVYQRTQLPEMKYDGYNNPNQQSAVLEELYYKQYYSKLLVNPELFVAYNRYYYKDDYNNMHLVSDSNYMEFKPDDRKNITKTQALNEGYYYNDGGVFKSISDYTGEYDDTTPTLFKQYLYSDTSNGNISILYSLLANYYILDLEQRPKLLPDASDYYYKICYNRESARLPYETVSTGEYFVLTNDNDEILVKSFNDVITSEADYDDYKGSIYSKRGNYNPLVDTVTSGIDVYLDHVSLKTLIDDKTKTEEEKQGEYENIPAIFGIKYTSVAGLDDEFYNNQVYELYSLKTSYSSLILASGRKPSYKEAQLKKCYYQSNEYTPITKVYSEYDNITEYMNHDEGEYYVIERGRKADVEAQNDGLLIMSYSLLPVKPSKKIAVQEGYYYISNITSKSEPTKYVKIDDSITDILYNSLKEIYEFDGMAEYIYDAESTALPLLYRRVSNFYNGYLYQPYKWQLVLQQGDPGVTEVKDIRDKWFDISVTNGTVIGSCSTRLQGIYSDEIYKDYYVQLYDANKNAIRNRARVASYDYSFGYVYPQDGYFTQKDIDKASYFRVYKDTNDPEIVSANRKVDYATTVDINVNISASKTISEKFHPESDFSKYFIQTYNGTVNESDIKAKLYDTSADPDAKIVVGVTTLLIKNQTASVKEGVNPSAYNGVFTLQSVTTSGSTTTLKWLRSANADTYADYIGRAWYVAQGSNSGKNFVSDAEAGLGTINSAPLTFTEEEPIEIYPTPDDKFAAEYGADFTYEDRKIYSPLFKNSNTRTFIRPFIGILDGMRFKYGLNYYDSTIIDSVDTNIWCIYHEALPYKKVLEPNTTSYTISSYFKSSDENPFFAYKKPYIKIDVKNLTNIVSENYLPTVANRYIISDAIYVQEQNKSWESYQWILYNRTLDAQIYKGDIKYAGNFETKIIGLENLNEYELFLQIEDEIGTTQTTSMEFAVYADISSEQLALTATPNCKDTQTVDFSFLGDGIIQPAYFTELTYNETAQYMEVSNNLINREYGNSYYQIALSGGIEPLPAPINNEFTLNSEHQLDGYYEGDIINLSFGDVDGKPNIDDSRIRLRVNSGTDTLISNGEIVVNPERNKLYAGLFTEFYRGDEVGWEAVQNASYQNKLLPMTIVEHPDGIGEDWALGQWRNVKPVKFSLGSSTESIDENYDYMYTTIAYGVDGNIIDGEYNLGSRDYNTNDPSTEKYKFAYRYGSESSDWERIKIGDIFINYSPLQTAPQQVSPDKTSEFFGVWYDEQVKSNAFDSSNFKLTTNRKAAFWSDAGAGGKSLYWCDCSPNYKCYKQVDLNGISNHSGREDFEKYDLTFNISVKNYDYSLDTGAVDFSSDLAQVFIKKR